MTAILISRRKLVSEIHTRGSHELWRAKIEAELKKSREEVRQRVQQNEQTEQFIEELDTKIGLLAHNKIARDEVAKLQKHIGGASMAMRRSMSTTRDFNHKSLTRETRAKMDLYSELLFILQTQPQYLTRYFNRLSARAAPETEYKTIENLVLSLFGFAQQRREEYYLLKLICAAMQEEQLTSPTHDLFRGSHLYLRLFNKYTKGHTDRKFLRTLVSRFLNETIVENPELDLESDPKKIYLAALKNEELSTGFRSERPQNVPPEVAIKDPETRSIFIQHLQDLRDIIDAFMSIAEDSISKMPYGVRYIAQQMFRSMRGASKRDTGDAQILQVVGQWVWKAYFKPAFADSELALEQGLNRQQSMNKDIFVGVMSHIISGREFDQGSFLQPLGNYVNSEAIPRIAGLWALSKSTERNAVHACADTSDSDRRPDNRRLL